MESRAPACDHGRMTPDRILPLAGGCNFRDCGGYATADGRRVRAGRLYRSGTLQHLTPADIDRLHALGLRAVCDLRRSDERARHPSPAFAPHVRCFQWETSTEASPIRDPAFAAAASLEEARGAMYAMYRRLPWSLRPRFAGVFDAMAHAGEGALVVHCSAGKDRTGVAIALVLAALGVPRETILADYAYTNVAVDLERHLLGVGHEGVGIAATAAPILALSPAARAAVLDAHASYLEATVAAIEARHGSITVYLEDELRIPATRLDELRDRWLE
jgi:protein-tyrosine phosphatase